MSSSSSLSLSSAFLFVLVLLLTPPTFAVSQHNALHTLRRSRLPERAVKTAGRLSKPLIGDDGRIYTCSEKNLLAFENNGSIAWTVHLNFTCDARIAPVHGRKGEIYLVAEDRVLRVHFSAIALSGPAAVVFFGPEPGQRASKVIGISVSTLSSCIYINLQNRGLFAYMMHGELLWSVGPVIDQFGYRQGCKRNPTDCYFASSPVIDCCESNIYIANTEGEIYSLSARIPHYKWIRDFSLLEKVFTITAGNNGRLYVTLTTRALVMALDVSTGNTLWQRSVGPLSSLDSAPVVDSNGWISIGSLDGCLYSISPAGNIKQYPKETNLDSVIQVSPVLDCSGYAIYISQMQMEGMLNHTMGNYTFVSALKPKNVILTMFVPATGSVHWSERYSNPFSSSLTGSDLTHFLLDERILLTFIAASKIGNPLVCRITQQRLASSCYQARSKPLSIYSGHERTILVFLFFESALLFILAGLIRFCCIFWRKKKLQGKDLGSFLEKRRSLQLKKKEFDRTISELKQKAANEAVSGEMLQELGDLVQKKESIARKLSTTYSLGRDTEARLSSKSLLPLYKKSYSFQAAMKESVTIFHTLNDTSSAESSNDRVFTTSETFQDRVSASKSKGKAPIEEESSRSSSSGGSFWWNTNPSEAETSSKEFADALNDEVDELKGEFGDSGSNGKVAESAPGSGVREWLKRRRTLSSTN